MGCCLAAKKTRSEQMVEVEPVVFFFFIPLFPPSTGPLTPWLSLSVHVLTNDGHRRQRQEPTLLFLPLSIRLFFQCFTSVVYYKFSSPNHYYVKRKYYWRKWGPRFGYSALVCWFALACRFRCCCYFYFSWLSRLILWLPVLDADALQLAN